MSINISFKAALTICIMFLSEITNEDYNITHGRARGDFHMLSKLMILRRVIAGTANY